MKLLVILAMLVAFSVSSSAQDWAKARLQKSPRHQEWVPVKAGNRTVQSFIVYPEVKNKATAVVVIHEIFGLTEWVQGVADQLAEAGYIAIAPDLLSGMGPNGGRTSDIPPDKVREFISKLPPDQITSDLNGVADYLKKLPAANGKVVVAGFCWEARSRSGSPPIDRTWLPPLSSMGPVRITRTTSPASVQEYMVSTAATTRASPPPCRKPKR